MCCGLVSCGAVWCGGVSCDRVACLVGSMVCGLLGSWVVWQVGFFVGCLAGWGMLCGVCTLWCVVLYDVVYSVMSCLWIPM